MNNEGSLRLELAPPVEMSGQVTRKTKSFELVAFAFSACMGGAVEKALIHQDVPYDDFSVQVTNNVFEDHKHGGKVFAFDIIITLEGVDPTVKHAVVDHAHKLCPFSKAIRGNVDTTVTIR